MVALCTYTTSDNYFRISYVRQGFDGEIDPTDQQDLYGNAAPNGVPDRIDGLERSLRIALAKYTDSATQSWTGVTGPLGFSPPEFPVDIELQKLFGVASGTDVTPPGFFGVLFGFDMYLDPVAGNLTSQPRHELFHTIQWRYADRTDYFNRSGTPFWAEATAEWALEQANLDLTGDAAEDYANNLPDFLGDSSATLEAHANWTDTNEHEYGAFLFADYLDQTFPSQDIIRRTWERIGQGDGLGADEAIDDVLRNQFGQPDGVAGVLPGFWQSVYPFTGFEASKVSVWRQILNRDDRTAADYALARAHHTSLQLLGGQTIRGSSLVETGGAAFIDFTTPLGRPGTMQVQVKNFKPGGLFTSDQPSDEDVKLTLYSFSSYPDLCRAPVVLTLSGGVSTSPPIALDSSCTFSTLVVTNARIFGGGDKLQEFTVSYQAAARPGDIVTAEFSGHARVYRPDGELVATWFTQSSGDETGMAFDGAGNLYVTNFDGNSVSKLGPDGAFLGFFGSGYSNSPESILFDPSGDAFVGHADGSHAIQKRSPSGTLLSTFSVATEDRGSDHLALRSDGCTLMYTSEGTRILQYDVCQGSQMPDLTTVPDIAYGLQVLPDDRLLVADSSEVYLLSPSGAQLAMFSDPSVRNQFFGIGLAPDGVHFWVTDCRRTSVYEGDLSAGTLTKVIQTSAPTWNPYQGFCSVGDAEVIPGGIGVSVQSRTPTTVPIPPATDHAPTSASEGAA